MNSNCNNIYRIARKTSINPETGKCYTVESVADLVPISPRSIAYYESGEMIPQDETVCKMVELYDAKWLAYAHIQRNTILGATYLPELDFRNLSECVLKLQVGMNDVNSRQFELIEMASDGVITKDEKERWEDSKKSLSNLVGNLLSILFVKEA